PYLVRLAFYYLLTNQISLDELETLSGSVLYVYQDYLKALLFILQRNPLLLDPLREILLGRKPLDIDSAIAYQLESLGLIEFRENRATISCRLYQYYFGQKLTRDRLKVDKLNQY
ncbi:MAG: AAA-like domain-containing protein, partial [Snowella sp.]